MQTSPLTIWKSRSLALALHALSTSAVAFGQANPAGQIRVLSGVVTDSQGNPVSFAYVFERESNIAIVTRKNGTFETGIPAGIGRLVFDARKIGFAPASVEIGPANVGPIKIILQRISVVDTVIVRANAQGYDEDLDRVGFYRRKATAIEGTFISSDAISRRSSMRASAFLRDATGTRLVYGGIGDTEAYPLGRGGMCPLGLVIDNRLVQYKHPSVERLRPRIAKPIPGQEGQPTAPAIFNESDVPETFDDLVPTSMVGGMEVYPSASSVPNELQHHVHDSCGLIVVWTGFRPK
jgi:hypothetical protein